MNRLKEKYGLVDPPAPLERFRKNPSLRNLCSVPKNQQTTEMIEAVIDEYDMDYEKYPNGVLEYLPKTKLTHDLRKRILGINGSDLRHISSRYISEDLVIAAVGNRWEALRWVTEEFMTPDVIALALNADGRSIAFVPEWMRTYDLCLAAVRNDRGDAKDHALAYTPRSIIRGLRGRELCAAAVVANPLAIAAVPKDYLTLDLIKAAIEKDPHAPYHSVIEFVPKNLMSKDLVELSLAVSPRSIRDLPPCATRFVTEDMCIKLISDDPDIVRFMPDKFLSRKAVADFALAQDPTSLRHIPMRMRTKNRCFAAKEKDPEGVSARWFPDDVLRQWEDLHPEGGDPDQRVATAALSAEIILAQALPLPAAALGNALAVGDTGRLSTHSFDESSERSSTLYYISDIHLEHQIPLEKCQSADEVRSLIEAKAEGLLKPFTPFMGHRATILVGGDIANSIVLVRLFYEALAAVAKRTMVGLRIVSVLGNHELWDAGNSTRAIEDILADYKSAVREVCRQSGWASCMILENDLYLVHKNSTICSISGDDILASDPDDLRELCAEASTMILGGLGYSGRNPKFNADMGLYREVLDMREDVARSKRFEAVHDKLAACAGDKRVVVLTHSPVQNWLEGMPNDNWIYINGHTHQNGMIAEEGGPVVLFDNQIGYEPKAWHLNSVELEFARYDPFDKWEDGIHAITSLQYREFYRNRGETMEFRRAGTPYVAKRAGVYMFFLQDGQKFYRLEGGRIYSIDHPIAWYFENMARYAERVRAALAPYQKALRMIADEVKSFGGWGTRHGCIVDIDFYNHIYLNPFDGAITPYFAEDMDNRMVFDSVKQLLEESLTLESLASEVLESVDSRNMLLRYDARNKAGELDLLSSGNIAARSESAIVPEQFLDRKTMYEPSRIMRSIQYLFDDDVIRIWRDSVLDVDLESSEQVEMPIGSNANHSTLPKGC